MKLLTATITPLLSLCLLVLPIVTRAADADPLFSSGEPLDITLTGPFSQIDRERDKDQEYPGTLSYQDNGSTVTLDVKFSVRGNFRLQKEICDYSQLWIDFDKDEVDGTLFDKQNKVKLVVQCQSNVRYSRYIAKEQQAYDMYNLITDRSFKSRLLNVTYHENDRGRDRTTLGIFIEHKDRLAKRIDMKDVELNSIASSELDPLQGLLANLYMYMISNVDFSLITAHEGEECCHNAKLFRADDGTYYPVPYDFDITGYVDTSYAGPNPDLKQRSIRQRIYRGYCVPDDVMRAALDIYRANADAILAIAANETYTDSRTANTAVRYLQGFFDTINDPKELQKDILDDCRQIR